MKRANAIAGAIALALWVSGSTAADLRSQAADREFHEALKLTPNLENGRKIYQVCTVCHRPEGWGSSDGRYPQIAGQLASVIIKQLADIRARNRDNPTMRPFASPRLLGGPQEIADVAAYVSQLPMDPFTIKGSGFDLEHGKKLYQENCADCHGDNGEGDAGKHIPRIHGQNIHYLTRQFEWIRIGKRRNADPKMVKQIRRFSPRDEAAVLDYVSHLKPPPEKLAKPGWQNPDFPNYARVPMPQPRRSRFEPPQPPQPPQPPVPPAFAGEAPQMPEPPAFGEPPQPPAFAPQPPQPPEPPVFRPMSKN
ncbi:MAG TPA: c-type cytochrome [Sedimenticola thiotaurini]|uniref:C-type cytochrome n=1 Tax=Sedimenticola thiotaurini TaxID=1543721 RepID=A0A831RQB2_9GAMM|nr:c-type cytochrome [Sedimenticola thiotaurini]